MAFVLSQSPPLTFLEPLHVLSGFKCKIIVQCQGGKKYRDTTFNTWRKKKEEKKRKEVVVGGRRGGNVMAVKNAT